MKTSELTGRDLDWAVAKALWTKNNGEQYEIPVAVYLNDYSTDWAKAGPIIDSEGISFTDNTYLQEPERKWLAHLPFTKIMDSEFGPTHLVAAMRAFVANVLGDEVDLPWVNADTIFAALRFAIKDA